MTQRPSSHPSRNPSRNSLSRRNLLKQATAGGLAMAATGTRRLAAAEPEDRSLRVISYNVYNCTDEYKLWTDAGWIDTFAKVGKGDGLTIKSDKPQWRIDYVMAAGAIAKNVESSKPLFEGAFRTNPADPESFALSDHLPQLAEFSYTVAKGS